MTFSGKMFIPSFVKIRQLIHEAVRTERMSPRYREKKKNTLVW